MAQNDLLKIGNQLCHPLYSTTNTLMRLYKPLLASLNITYPQYLILMVLWEEDGINMNAVSERTYFDSGTLTPLIKKLKQKGFIQIEVNKADRRNKILFLTPKGQRLKTSANAVPKSLMCFVPFSKEDTLNYMRMTRRLHKALLDVEDKAGVIRHLP